MKFQRAFDVCRLAKVPALSGSEAGSQSCELVERQLVTCIAAQVQPCVDVYVDYQRFADQLMKYAHGRPSKEQEKEREQKYAAVKACLVSRKLYPFPHPPK